MKKRILSILLCVILVSGIVPLTVFAGHTCPDCGEWIDGDPYCKECYRCGDCVTLCSDCQEICEECKPICSKCGRCEDCGGEICQGCTDSLGEVICKDCAIDEGYHCPDCEACYFEVGDWCDDCGRCYECVEKCEGCSSNFGRSICVECAIGLGYHCPDCEACYFEVGDWCDECGKCYDCVSKCDGCSGGLGYSICVECAIDEGYHCPECEICYFEVGDWCDECGKCYECVEKCEGCSGEIGISICVDCAIDQGYHCPDCFQCYFEVGDWCDECGRCFDCVEKCDGCSSEFGRSLCVECAQTLGNHCPDCGTCYMDAEAYCSECGRCSECADEFCMNCNLCSDCTEFCSGCGHCSGCADICPNCGAACSECSEICSYCGFCQECCRSIAEANGCDCDSWVCIENPDWDSHFASTHQGASKTHTAKASSQWSFNSEEHWHSCLYCENADHYTDLAAHSYSSDGKCTVCGYNQNAAIQILQQPADAENVLVNSGATVKFTVKAEGNSKLTYQWYRGFYITVNHRQQLLKHKLDVSEQSETEDYEGPSITVLAPSNSCNQTYYYFCVITDEQGNTVTSDYAKLNANHNFTVVKEGSCTEEGHILYCSGYNCTQSSELEKHTDKNCDYVCDACGYELEKVLSRISLIYDEVQASFHTGETQKEFQDRLSTALHLDTNSSYYGYFKNLYITTIDFCTYTDGTWYGMQASGSSGKIIDADSKYAIAFLIKGKLPEGVVLPSTTVVSAFGYFYMNGKPLSTSDFTIKRCTQTGRDIEISFRLYVTPSTQSTHKITVNYGTASGNSMIYTDHAIAGQTVYLSTSSDDSPIENGVFSHWNCTKGTITIKNPSRYITSFVMPDEDVEIEAVFTAKNNTLSLSGTITSYGDGSKQTTVQLCKPGETVPKYTQTLTGNHATYTIADVAPGTYEMTVTKSLHNSYHCTIEVNTQNVTKDIVLYQIGDVDGNGIVEARDYIRLKRYVLGTYDATEEEISRMDVNGDGKVNAKDYIVLKRYVLGTYSF